MSKRRLAFLLLVCVSICAAASLASSYAQQTASTGAPAGSEMTAAADSGAENTSAHGIAAGEKSETWLGRFKESGLVDYYVRGGVFMHPILFCSILGLAVIIERLYVLSKARTNTKALMNSVLSTFESQGIEAARTLLERTKGPVAAVLHAGLLRIDRGTDAVEKSIVSAAAIEVTFLERGLIWLSSVANIAPLLGFLGTVSGMIHAFEAIAAAEYVSAKLVSAGIAEALITTAAGLMVAIPVQMAYNYFVQTIDRFVVEMEESAADLLDALARTVGTKAAS